PIPPLPPPPGPAVAALLVAPTAPVTPPLPTSPPEPEVTRVPTTAVPASRVPPAACWLVGSTDPAQAQRAPRAQVTTDARMDSIERDDRPLRAGPRYSPIPHAFEIERDRGYLT